MTLATHADDLAAVRSAASNEEAFRGLVAPLQRELHAYCYRMLGSFHDAEDVLQDALLRAWRGLSRFDGRASFRAWLYRIATNACIDLLRRRKRRVLPADVGAPVDGPTAVGEPHTEIPWLEPYPDSLLTAANPEAVVEARDGVRIAFLRAIQLLPPRQRAALILREVLDWSTADIAALLETTAASVNSALQRARTTVRTAAPSEAWWDLPQSPAPDDRELLARFMGAWERQDIDGVVALLREDAALSMPPFLEWFSGVGAIRRFLTEFAFDDTPRPHVVFQPIAANGQPAYVSYHRQMDGTWDPPRVLILDIIDGRVADVTLFDVDASLYPLYGIDPTPPLG